jgi:DNA-binding NarL/FixJ family response regulator
VVDISVAMGGDAFAWQLTAAELVAWQGDDERARELTAIQLSHVMQAVGAGVMTNVARLGLIALDLARGRYREAFDHAWSVFEIDPASQGNQVLPEVVEAGLRCDERDAAAAALDRLERRASLAGTPWALGLLARSKALVADDDADALYEEALDHLARTAVATDLARTHLLYGEWLRRRRRRSDARDHLRRAHQMFDAMGARAFADRAGTELSATGERARRRTFDTANDLTPQESRIARLAATGATNREIGAQLFISAATVEHHLRNVYRKLGVTSRRQLTRERARLLATDDEP